MTTAPSIGNSIEIHKSATHQYKFSRKLTAISLTIVALLVGLTYGSSSTQVTQAQGASVPLQAPANSAVLTYKNSPSRTGQFANEVTLNLNNVNSKQFGKRVSYPVDGQVYAEPLYVPNLIINGSLHNVVIVATQHDSIYAFDADRTSTAAPLWHTSYLGPNVSSVSSNSVSCGDIHPEYGISGTPVIDSSTNTMYLVANTMDHGTNTYRLHAVNITTGHDKHPSTIISAAAHGIGDGNVNHIIHFDPVTEGQRTGLLLNTGRIYFAFGSHCDIKPYHGWIMSYSASSLSQIATYNSTKSGYDGGIWEAGDGITADTHNHIYVMTGNGSFNRNIGGTDLGDSFIKIDITGGNFNVQDYFTPFNQVCLNAGDLDLGSGGTALLPGNEVLGAGKEGRIYILNQNKMGGYTSIANPCANEARINVDKIVQETHRNTAAGGVWGTPAFWNGSNGQYVYTIGVNDHVKAFKFSNGKISTTPSSQSPEGFGYPGGNPVVSSNGTTAGTGILWTIDPSAVLRAYNATNLSHEIYNSNQDASRDSLGTYVKFTVPTIANGEVFVGTKNSLKIYGELKSTPIPAVYNNVGISSDSNRTAANYDGGGASYSQQALQAVNLTAGQPVTVNGVSFTWPNVAAGSQDNYIAQGQTLPFTPVSNAHTLAFLGSASQGPSSGTATITYSDHTTQQVTLGFSDWTLNGGKSTASFGNLIAATTSYRNIPTGPQTVKTYVFYAQASLIAGKTIQSVTFPSSVNQGVLHIFAAGTK